MGRDFRYQEIPLETLPFSVFTLPLSSSPPLPSYTIRSLDFHFFAALPPEHQTSNAA